MKKSPGAFVAKSKRKKATARAGDLVTPAERKALAKKMKQAKEAK